MPSDGDRGGSETLRHTPQIQRGHGTDLIPHGYLARRNASTIVRRCTCHAGTMPAVRPTSTAISAAEPHVGRGQRRHGHRSARWIRALNQEPRREAGTSRHQRAARTIRSSTRPSTRPSVKPSVLSTASSFVRSRTALRHRVAADEEEREQHRAEDGDDDGADVADLLGDRADERVLGRRRRFERRIGKRRVDQLRDVVGARWDRRHERGTSPRSPAPIVRVSLRYA